jgi:hypothetical protein
MNPEFIIVRPFGRFTGPRSAAVELGTGLVIISPTQAIDVFGRLYVTELTNGDVGLFEIGKGPVSSVAVPKM